MTEKQTVAPEGEYVYTENRLLREHAYEVAQGIGRISTETEPGDRPIGIERIKYEVDDLEGITDATVVFETGTTVYVIVSHETKLVNKCGISGPSIPDAKGGGVDYDQALTDVKGLLAYLRINTEEDGFARQKGNQGY